MCGDVGFPEKLFRCSRCCNRYQHSYGSLSLSLSLINVVCFMYMHCVTQNDFMPTDVNILIRFFVPYWMATCN